MTTLTNHLNEGFQLSIFAAIMERHSGLVGIRDMKDGKLIYMNEAGMKMLETEDILEAASVLDSNQIGYNQTGVGIQEEITWMNKKGETVRCTYENLLFRYNNHSYCFFRMSDIGSVLHYRQQIEKELQRFGALFDYASLGIIVANEQGEIVMINDFALTEFGYRREELLGKKVEQLLPRRFHEKHIGHRNRYNRHPQNRPMGIGMDLYAVRSNGTEFPVEISLSHYHNEEGAFVIAYINNITLRKKAEEEIEKLNTELEQMVEDRTLQLRKALEQLELSKEELMVALGREKELGELKSRFVSMASHEFRTPLSTILSSAFLVKQYAAEADQPKRNRHLQRIVSSVNLLTDILNDFLSVGKIEEGKIQVRMMNFNVPEQIADMIQEVQGLLKEGQHVEYEHTGDPEIALDPTLLRHIIMNLLVNAVKFSPAHSRVHLRTANKGDAFSLEVKDQGIGMSKEDQQHLFERFFRGANAANIQGTGLGLHIVSKYSELMNGHISCNSELEKGTTFTIVFPLNKVTGYHENNSFN